MTCRVARKWKVPAVGCTKRKICFALKGTDTGWRFHFTLFGGQNELNNSCAWPFPATLIKPATTAWKMLDDP